MNACQFTFDGERNFDGLSEGTKWNGFDNVRVTPAVFQEIKEYFDTPDTDPEEWNVAIGADGYHSLGFGFATMIIEAETERDDAGPDNPNESIAIDAQCDGYEEE
jgi:hypothetical protein